MKRPSIVSLQCRAIATAFPLLVLPVPTVPPPPPLPPLLLLLLLLAAGMYSDGKMESNPQWRN